MFRSENQAIRRGDDEGIRQLIDDVFRQERALLRKRLLGAVDALLARRRRCDAPSCRKRLTLTTSEAPVIGAAANAARTMA